MSTKRGCLLVTALIALELLGRSMHGAKPRGDVEFDPALFEAVLASMLIDPERAGRVAAHSSRIAADVRRIQYAEQEFATNMRAVVQRVPADADAPGGTREFNGAYEHAWRLRDGSYLLSTDPNFDPWQSPQIEGRRLQPLRRGGCPLPERADFRRRGLGASSCSGAACAG